MIDYHKQQRIYTTEVFRMVAQRMGYAIEEINPAVIYDIMSVVRSKSDVTDTFFYHELVEDTCENFITGGIPPRPDSVAACRKPVKHCPGCGDPAGPCVDQHCVRTDPRDEGLTE